MIQTLHFLDHIVYKILDHEFLSFSIATCTLPKGSPPEEILNINITWEIWFVAWGGAAIPRISMKKLGTRNNNQQRSRTPEGKKGW
jgi:hypothetical protein